MIKILPILLLTSLVSFISKADQCSVNFNYGVIIDPSHIRMIDMGQTVVQINDNHQLFVQGREIQLNEQQQQLINQFSSDIRAQVPEIVSIAIDGVDIGLKAVNKAIGSLTGENSAAQQKVQAKFDELKWRIRARFNQSANNYYIAPQDFTDLDDIFTGEFEQEIEEIITDSIGTILLAVGEAMIKNNDNNDSGHSEQRLSTFDERIETMGKGLELEISANATALKNKAEQFCLKLNELDNLESEIQHLILPLKKYNLIEAN